jgi:hypothetical protein
VARIAACVIAACVIGATGTPAGSPAHPISAQVRAGLEGSTEPAGVCADPAATWLGTRWRSPMRWRFNAASVPAYLGAPAAARDSVARAAGNLTTAANPCGLTGRPAMSQRYDGDTGGVAAVRPDGGCGARNGVNEVSFGDLAPGLLAVTCMWWRNDSRGGDGSTVEADILISSRDGLFYLGRQPEGCQSTWDLEGAITHEFGHAFGLGHVAADQHPHLTMSDGMAPCDNSHRGIGLGDYEMLRAHY